MSAHTNPRPETESEAHGSAEDMVDQELVKALAKVLAAKRRREDEFPSLKIRKRGRYDPVRDVITEDVEDVEMSEF